MESSEIGPSTTLEVSNLEKPAEDIGHGRQRSEEGEQEITEQQTGPGKSSPSPKEDAQPAEATASQETHKSTTEPLNPANKTDDREARRKSSIIVEKQRNKRLFGALLGSLNQPSDRAAKRRAEIEQRRKAELQKQDEERLEDRQRKLDQLNDHRHKVQKKLDEENLYLRHSDMLQKARFLQTKTEPKLYYRPWELLPSQEDIIEDQIRDTKAKIDQELADLEKNKRPETEERQSVTRDRIDLDPALTSSHKSLDNATDGEVTNFSATETEKPSNLINTHEQAVGTNGSITSEKPDSRTAEAPNVEPDGKAAGQVPTVSSDKMETDGGDGRKDDSDDEGDHVVEGDEDNVIY